jgi:hypothetical protein
LLGSPSSYRINSRTELGNGLAVLEVLILHMASVQASMETNRTLRVMSRDSELVSDNNYSDSQKSSRNEITLRGKAAEPPKADEYLKMLSGMARPTSPSPH